MASTDFDRLIQEAKRARRRIGGADARKLDSVVAAVEELSKVLEELLTALKEQEQAQARSHRSGMS